VEIVIIGTVRVLGALPVLRWAFVGALDLSTDTAERINGCRLSVNPLSHPLTDPPQVFRWTP